MNIEMEMTDNGPKVDVGYVVDAMEDELRDQIGPFVKFIINKCLVEMGHTRSDELTMGELIEFIDRVTKMAISDEKVREGVIDRISMKLEIKIHFKKK